MVHTDYGHTLAIAKARNISDDSPDNILIEVLNEDTGKDDNRGNLSLNGLDLIGKQSLVKPDPEVEVTYGIVERSYHDNFIRYGQEIALVGEPIRNYCIHTRTRGGFS